MRELDNNKYFKDKFLCYEGKIYSLEKETDYGYIVRDGADRVAFFNKKNLSYRCGGGSSYKEIEYGYLIDKFTYLEFLDKAFNCKCQLKYGYRDIEETDVEYEIRVRTFMDKFNEEDADISQVRDNVEVSELYDYISKIPGFEGDILAFADGKKIVFNSEKGIINAPFGEIFRDIKDDWYIFDKDTKRVISVVRSDTLPCIRFKGEDSFYALYDRERGVWLYTTNICDEDKIVKSNSKNKSKVRVRK